MACIPTRAVDRLGVMMRAMVMMPMIMGSFDSDGDMRRELTRQVRVLAAAPGVNHLAE